MIRLILLTSSAIFGLTACGGSEATAPQAPASEEAAETTIPAETDTPNKLADVAAGSYSLDKGHAHLTAYVGHNGGISDYRISFVDFDAKLNFDPASPEAGSITVDIVPSAIETNYPGDYKAGHANSAFETWNEDVARNKRWLNTDVHPTLSFTSTSVIKTGPYTGDVTGTLNFLGIEKSVTMAVTYNGLANPPWLGGVDVIGFNASTVINRSEFGMSAFIPNITDAVRIEFSGEFVQDTE